MPEKKKKKKEKRKAKAFVQTPPQFWEGQPWDLKLCPTRFISVFPGPRVLGRTRAAELLQLHCPAALQPGLSHQLCPWWLRFGCHGSCDRAAARALLCSAWLSYLLAPGWLFMMGETLVFSVVEAKPILTTMEGSAWDKPDPSQKAVRKADSCFFCPMSCGSSTALGMARDNFILAYVTWSKLLVLVFLPCVSVLSLTSPGSPCPSKPSVKIPPCCCMGPLLPSCTPRNL